MALYGNFCFAPILPFFLVVPCQYAACGDTFVRRTIRRWSDAGPLRCTQLGGLRVRRDGRYDKRRGLTSVAADFLNDVDAPGLFGAPGGGKPGPQRSLSPRLFGCRALKERDSRGVLLEKPFWRRCFLLGFGIGASLCGPGSRWTVRLVPSLAAPRTTNQTEATSSGQHQRNET